MTGGSGNRVTTSTLSAPTKPQLAGHCFNPTCFFATLLSFPCTCPAVAPHGARLRQAGGPSPPAVLLFAAHHRRGALTSRSSRRG